MSLYLEKSMNLLAEIYPQIALQILDMWAEFRGKRLLN